MTKIIVAEDCGNAPKRLLLRDLTIAFVNDDLPVIVQNLADNVRWEVMGGKVVEGKEVVAKELEQISPIKATELTIKNILTHGVIGAVDGIVQFEDAKNYAFCNVIRFSSNAKNAKIREITSYLIAA